MTGLALPKTTKTTKVKAQDCLLLMTWNYRPHSILKEALAKRCRQSRHLFRNCHLRFRHACTEAHRKIYTMTIKTAIGKLSDGLSIGVLGLLPLTPYLLSNSCIALVL